MRQGGGGNEREGEAKGIAARERGNEREGEAKGIDARGRSVCTGDHVLMEPSFGLY